MLRTKHAKNDARLDAVNNNLEQPAASQISESYLRALVVKGELSFLRQELDKYGENAAVEINKHSLLQTAVDSEQYEVLELLLQYGGEVNNRNSTNLTALHIAAKSLNLRAMQILVNHGADINATSSDGRSVLHYIVQRTIHQEKALQTLKWLVDFGACTDVVDKNAWTLLHAAAYVLHTDLIDYLVCELHQDIQAVDKHGRTPLFVISNGINEFGVQEERGIITAARLLKYGARIFVLNESGLTPGEFAATWGHQELAEYLENLENQQRQLDLRKVSPGPDLDAKWCRRSRGWSAACCVFHGDDDDDDDTYLPTFKQTYHS